MGPEKLISLTLSISLLLGLCACTQAPVITEPSGNTLSGAPESPSPAGKLLSALFDGNQTLQERHPVPCGADFRMHFADFVIVDGVIRAYYIANDPSGRLVTGLAESTDGRNFTDRGIVIPCGTDYDSGYAAFAGAVYRDGITYLVYECLGQSGGQDIALATSADGFHFEKQGVILDNLDCPQWCSYNVGTPDLVYANDMWYLFFHGYDGTDCQTGVACGPSLDALAVHPTPVLPTSRDPSEPDSGTVGRRDIVYADGWYYMVYEVSTDKVGADFGNSYWTHMFARSRDLIHWEKRPPLVSQSLPGMGYDGPNWLIQEDRVYIYYRTGGNITCRVELSLNRLPQQ